MIRLEKQFQQNPPDDIEEDIKLIKQDIDDMLQEQINGIVICGRNVIGKNTVRNL